MKEMALIFSLIFTIHTFAEGDRIILGGVDVGNGMVIDSGFEIPNGFKTEEEVLKYIEEIKKQIVTGESEYVKRLVRLGDCSHKNIQLQNVFWKKNYVLSGKNKLKPSFKGVVNIGLSKCRRPEIVQISDNLNPKIPSRFKY